MSSLNEISISDTIHNSTESNNADSNLTLTVSASNETSFSTKMDKPTFSNSFDDHDDEFNEIEDDQDSEDDGDGDSVDLKLEKNGNILEDPEFTNDTKLKLIYSESTFSDDHLFYLQNNLASVSKRKIEIYDIKMNIQKARASGEALKCQNLGKTLEALEQSFVKQHVYKIKFDENLPPTEPLSNELRDNVYRIVRYGILQYKVNPCPAQRKMKKYLKKLKKHVNILKQSGNKYASNMQNDLFYKEKQYKEMYLVRKTPEEIELEDKNKYMTRFRPTPEWIHELSHADREYLIYSRDSKTRDHKFWINSKNRMVKDSKFKIQKLKLALDKARQSGNEGNITVAEEILEKKKEFFVNNHVHKVEFDETEPTITPLLDKYRQCIHGSKNALNLFQTQFCPEQKSMLLEIRKSRKMCNQMFAIENKFAEKMLNKLYHIEHDYKKKFLTLLDPNIEQTLIDEQTYKEKNREKLLAEQMKKKKVKGKIKKLGRKRQKQLVRDQMSTNAVRKNGFQNLCGLKTIPIKDDEPLASWELKESITKGKFQPKGNKKGMSNEKVRREPGGKNMIDRISTQSSFKHSRKMVDPNNQYDSHNQSNTHLNNYHPQAPMSVNMNEPITSHQEINVISNNYFNTFLKHHDTHNPPPPTDSSRNNYNSYGNCNNYANTYDESMRNRSQRNRGFEEHQASNEHSKDFNSYKNDYSSETWRGYSPPHEARSGSPITGTLPKNSYDTFYDSLDDYNYPNKKLRRNSPPVRNTFQNGNNNDTHHQDGGYNQFSRRSNAPSETYRQRNDHYQRTHSNSNYRNNRNEYSREGSGRNSRYSRN